MRNRFVVDLLAAGMLCAGLGACSPMLASDEREPSPTFSIGGRVSGATGTIVLQNSNGTNLIVQTDGSFTFERPMVSSALYNVTVAVAPDSQTCRVANGAGTVALANISDVTVTCSQTAYAASNRVASDFQ